MKCYDIFSNFYDNYLQKLYFSSRTIFKQKNRMRLIPLFIIIFCSLNTTGKPIDYLFNCWTKQIKPLQKQHLSFTYQEKKNDFDHGYEAFQLKSSAVKGIVWVNTNNFIKRDTLSVGSNTFFSSTQWSKATLLYQDYGDKDLYKSTIDMHQDLLFQQARYSPTSLINYFVAQKVTPSSEFNTDAAVYTTTINGSVIKLYIRKSNYLLDKVTMLCKTDYINDELFGDVLTSIFYKNYEVKKKLSYPLLVRIEKINGKIEDEVANGNVKLEQGPQLLTIPAEYALAAQITSTPEVLVEKYSDRIHFIQLKHTNDKVMIVEFKDFLFVAEAPLNSKNGELIIKEAKKIAPNKPIRYFAFGHFHTHYIGGVRAFVHKGTTVLSTKANIPYVQFIINAAHTLSPDSLQLEPKPMQIEEVGESKTITDGEFEMKIYFIGMKSQHTKDYLIYYFPSEQLLFEDDLVWIALEGKIKKASARQAGLHSAIKELNLNVKTIVQSWPVEGYGVKTIIPYRDLEESVKLK